MSGGGGLRSVLGLRLDVNEVLKFWGKLRKKNWRGDPGGGGGGGRVGGGGGQDGCE